MTETHQIVTCDVCGAPIAQDKPYGHVHMPLTPEQAEGIIAENEKQLQLHPMASLFPGFVQMNVAQIRAMPKLIRVDLCLACSAPFEKAAGVVAARLVREARDKRLAEAC